MFGKCNFDNSSTDSQFTENDEELSFLEACMDCDEDALYDVIQDGVTWEQVNERDKSGRTSLSYACANGFMPILELLATLEEVDVNLPDNDGNTPLIFAAQAGHDDVVNFLLHHFRRIKIDQTNHLGFTGLMKAAIQGRTRCAKVLLFAGANPNRRDFGRGLCAEDWAKFCGRQDCANAINKYLRSKKYFLKKTFLMSREKWSSEPNLATRKPSERNAPSGSWLKRHLSFKRKKRPEDADDSPGITPPLDAENRAGSAPILILPDTSETTVSASAMRRPSCLDGVVSMLPKPKHNGGQIGSVAEEVTPWEPPTILETDFDSENPVTGVG